MKLELENLSNEQLENIEKQITLLKESKKKQEQDNNLSKKFSKYVMRNGGFIGILGENVFKSYGNTEINYTNDYRKDYDTPCRYIKTTLSELEKGDVFIKCDNAECMELHHFGIFAGINRNGNYIHQYLYKSDGLEVIDAYQYSHNFEVYKFLRY